MSWQLTDLEQLLLLSALRHPGDAIGAVLQDDVESQAGRRVSLGTIHLTMTRLEERGFVESWIGEPTGGRGGKGRRHYRVTPEGVAVLQETRRIVEEMWAGVPEGRT